MSRKFSFFFLQNWKKWNQEKIVFYVVVFDPIKIRLAPQNVRQNFSFVEDINAVGRKMARNGYKMTKS